MAWWNQNIPGGIFSEDLLRFRTEPRLRPEAHLGRNFILITPVKFAEFRLIYIFRPKITPGLHP